MPEGQERRQVTRDSMAAVIAQVTFLTTPHCGLRLMLPADQFCPDWQQLRHYPLLRRSAPHREGSVLRRFPQITREPQKGKGLRLTFTTLPPVLSGDPPNWITLVCSGCNSKPNFTRGSRNSSTNRSASISEKELMGRLHREDRNVKYRWIVRHIATQWEGLSRKVWKLG